MSAYDLEAPCGNCPFRTVGFVPLRSERIEEIVNSDGEFPCHKTVEYDDDDGEAVQNEATKVCVGFLILLEKIERPNQMMRIAERLGLYNAKALMEGPGPAMIFDDLEDMIEAHEAFERRGRKRGNSKRVRKVRCHRTEER